MSEDSGNKTPPSSGIGPGGRRPTVIGVRVMLNKESEKPAVLKPTVIGPTNPATTPLPPPTAIGTIPKATVLLKKEVQATQTPPPKAPLLPTKPTDLTKPSGIPGATVRKGVDVSIDDLAKHLRGVSAEALEQAQKILKQTMPDSLTDTQCAMWGSERHKKFGELIEKSLKLAESPCVRDGERHLSHLHTLLEELHEALQSKNRPAGFLTSILKQKSPWEKFRDMNPELNQIRALLSQLLPKIIDAKTSLASLPSEFKTLATSLEAEAIAGSYLAKECLKGKQTAVQVLMDRSSSLLGTVTHISQNSLSREQVISHLGQLVACIQNGVLSALPAWIDSVTLTLRRSSQTETDMYGLREGLERIIDQLK